MACRLPGAENLDQFWEVVRRGECTIVEMPPDRLDRSLYFNPAKGFEGKTYSTIGGMVSIPPFDPRLCSEPGSYDISI